MRVIYVPKGAAREYAELACNLYYGCPGRCRYCYVPPLLRVSRNAYGGWAEPRPYVVYRLQGDLYSLRMRRDRRPVFLCFTSDPYPAEGVCETTRKALEEFRRYGHPVTILTKMTDLAVCDLDLLALIPGAMAMVSLVWEDDEQRALWEPGASSVASRLRYLEAAREKGIRTGASVEPVIDPSEAVKAIRLLMEAGVSDIRVGRLQHMSPPVQVDWGGFSSEVTNILREWAGKAPGRTWVLKKGLKELVDE